MASFIAAFQRAEIMGINHPSDDECRTVIQDYMAIANDDHRRITWIVERAANDTADQIAKTEADIVVAERFNQVERAEKLAGSLVRYENDFRFLYAVLQLLKNRAIDIAVKNWAESFGHREKKTAVKKGGA